MDRSHQDLGTLHKQIESLLDQTYQDLIRGEYSLPNYWQIKGKGDEIKRLTNQVASRYDDHSDELRNFVRRTKLADELDKASSPFFAVSIPFMSYFLHGVGGFLKGKSMSETFPTLFNNSNQMSEKSKQQLMENVFKNVTPQEYAALSEVIYLDDGKMEDRLKQYGIDLKFQLATYDGVNYIYHDKISGLDAALFKIGDSNEYIAVFRGTEGYKLTGYGFSGTIRAVEDILQDINEILSIPLPGIKNSLISQKNSADGFMEKVNGIVKKNGGSLTATGHSLGGWLATVEADQYNIPAVTFNAPSFTNYTEMGLKNGNKNIVNFKVDNDPVSREWKYINMNYSPGVTISVPNLERSIAPHGVLNHFHFDEKGSIAINSGQGDLYRTVPVNTPKINAYHVQGVLLEANQFRYTWYDKGKEQLVEEKRNLLIQEINKIIEEEKKLSPYKSLGEKYAPAELNKDEIDLIDNRIKELREETQGQTIRDEIAGLEKRKRELETKYQAHEEEEIKTLEFYKNMYK